MADAERRRLPDWDGEPYETTWRWEFPAGAERTDENARSLVGQAARMTGPGGRHVGFAKVLEASCEAVRGQLMIVVRVQLEGQCAPMAREVDEGRARWELAPSIRP